MTTFDKLMLFFGNAATALTGVAVVAKEPVWLVLVCLAVSAGCNAVAPSVMSSKRATVTPPTP